MNRIQIINTDGTTEYQYVDVVEDDITSNVVNYEEEVERLIRQHYSVSDELALLRQRDIKQAEYQQYYEYCEQCKTQARLLSRELFEPFGKSE